jgi:hypothetical protein
VVMTCDINVIACKALSCICHQLRETFIYDYSWNISILHVIMTKDIASERERKALDDDASSSRSSVFYSLL